MEIIPTRELLDVPGSGTTYHSIAARVKAGELVRLRRGAVMPRTDLSPDERLRCAIEAAALVLNAGTWFSHRSAALVHGLPVFLRPDTRVEVVRTMGGHGNRRVRLHARSAVLLPGDGVRVDGLPVTSVERTTLDLVRELPFPQAVMVADAALRLGADRGGLLGRIPPGRGCRKAERALVFADPASESAGESESRARMAMAGLPAPELQVDLYDDDGTFIARPDFYWRGKRVVGEYDGAGKYQQAYGLTAEEAVRREKNREVALEKAGYHLVRWGKDALREPGELERRVRKVLASHPWI